MSPAVVEGLLALLGGIVLAVLTRRPQDLSTAVAGADARDPVLLSWILAWPAHALTTADRLWDGNVFAPLDNTLAFSDPLLGYLPFGLVGEGPGAALVRFNLVHLFATALAFAGTWLLVRQLGLGRTAALVAAVAFAVNPWRVSQINHLQVLSSGGIPLALAMLARGHGLGLRTGARPVRPGWAFAGWVTAAWHFSIGPGLGLQLAYLLAICTAVALVLAVRTGLRDRVWPTRRLVAADATGMAVFLAAGLLLAMPFLQAVEDHPEARRVIEEVRLYSASPAALVTAPGDSWLWGRRSAELREGVLGLNEKALFPGAMVTALAGVGLLAGSWTRRRRVVLAGSVVVLAVCALGLTGPADGRYTYQLLYDHLPGWQGVRTPTRLVTTAWLGLVLLAAHGVTVLLSLLEDHRGRRGRPADRSAGVALSFALAAVVLLEGLDTAGLTPVRPPPQSVSLRELPGSVLVLPSEDHLDQDVMRWSTDGFPQVVNGVSGFPPQLQLELRDAAARLPDPTALERLRSEGVRSLVILPALLPGTRYQQLDISALAALPGVSVDVRGDAVVVYLGVTS
ncbi:MAG: hypothetical protein Q8R60_06825 [Mycobacteriales bacterium]|nr:hypothetical protein [Mycobacteriales bacterium]